MGLFFLFASFLFFAGSLKWRQVVKTFSFHIGVFFLWIYFMFLQNASSSISWEIWLSPQAGFFFIILVFTACLFSGCQEQRSDNWRDFYQLQRNVVLLQSSNSEVFQTHFGIELPSQSTQLLAGRSEWIILIQNHLKVNHNSHSNRSSEVIRLCRSNHFESFWLVWDNCESLESAG